MESKSRESLIEEDQSPRDSKKEPYIFSGFGHKLRSSFGRFMQDHLHEKSPPATPTQPQSSEADVFQEVMINAVGKIPFYFTHSDPGNPHPKYNPATPIPILFFLLKLTVLECDADEDDFEKRFYSLKLQYGQAMSWNIKRRAVDILKLHYILQWKHLKGRLPALPKLPSMKFLRGKSRAGQSTSHYINQYFSALFHKLDFNCKEMCEFLEISSASIVRPDFRVPDVMSIKPLEGYLRCTIKLDSPEISGPRNLIANLRPRRNIYKNHWLMLRSSCIVVAEGPNDLAFTDVFMVDPFFKIGVANEYTRYSFARHLHPFSITIFNGQDRRLKVRPDDRAQVEHWLEKLRELAANSEWCQPHRFASFAPIRKMPADSVEWLIDAREYFSSVARAIEHARREIFIQGWWVSPELQLIRPTADFPDYRLDRLLKKRAEEGIKIYIVVFKEIAMSLAINSLYTKISLRKLHPNIRVIRHPDHYAAGILYWAHHEKLVIIDQRVAYVGGLDLCYGRFDSPEHPLSDMGKGIWTGLEYANPCVRQYQTVTDPNDQIIDCKTIPRMPWHDVQMRIVGAAAQDLARHFIIRWNFVKAEKGLETIPFLLPDYPISDEVEENEDFIQAQIVRCSARWSLGLPLDTSLYDAHMSIISKAQKFIFLENQFLVSRENKVAEAIAERIISAHREKADFRVIVVIPLLPAFEAPLERPEATTCRIVMQAQFDTLSRGPHALLKQLKSAGIEDPSQYLGLFALRMHGQLGEVLVTEQIYVHSKVLLADDQVALISSANINDRSLLGYRDAEVGCIVEGAIVKQLRKRLFAEHLQLELDDNALEMDVSSEAFYKNILYKRAEENTLAYRNLFFCLPDDTVRTWADYRAAKEKAAKLELKSLSKTQLSALETLKGHIVMFPTEFLAEEDLSASIFSTQFLLPLEVYI